MPECNIWHWWSQTLCLIVIETTAEELGTCGLQYKLSFIDTSILDSWISIIWLLNVSMRCINKETRLFFGENILSGDFVSENIVFQKEQITHWWKCHTFLVWNPVTGELLYARNRKVLWRILFIWSIWPTLLRRWNLFY